MNLSPCQCVLGLLGLRLSSATCVGCALIGEGRLSALCFSTQPDVRYGMGLGCWTGKNDPHRLPRRLIRSRRRNRFNRNAVRSVPPGFLDYVKIAALQGARIARIANSFVGESELFEPRNANDTPKNEALRAPFRIEDYGGRQAAPGVAYQAGVHRKI